MSDCLYSASAIEDIRVTLVNLSSLVQSYQQSNVASLNAILNEQRRNKLLSFYHNCKIMYNVIEILVRAIYHNSSQYYDPQSSGELMMNPEDFMVKSKNIRYDVACTYSYSGNPSIVSNTTYDSTANFLSLVTVDTCNVPVDGLGSVNFNFSFILPYTDFSMLLSCALSPRDPNLDVFKWQSSTLENVSGYNLFYLNLNRYSTLLKPLFELIQKNLFLLKSVSFKQDADLKQTHSKSFLQFLLGKLKDNSSDFVNQLGFSDSVSNAQTELELPNSANTALTLYTGGVSTLDWLTDLLNLFIEFINSLSEYNQNSKIDQILECNFDAKKFNRLLGDALNYARSNENAVLVKRNDQEYIDLNPDNQACLDWDGGLPALVNHRHYDFQSFFQFLGKKSDGSDDLDVKFYLSKELVKMLENGFVFNL